MYEPIPERPWSQPKVSIPIFNDLTSEDNWRIIALSRSLCYRRLMSSFEDLGIPPSIISGLALRAINTPTAVQSAVIPLITNGEDVLFQSETGTGKTFCYLIPAFTRVLANPNAGSPSILIIAPTHELAAQIKNEAVRLSADSGLTITAALCVGGAPLKRQVDMLKEKPDVLVGGPARILELIRLKKLKTAGISLVVFDETDRMLAPEMRDVLGELIGVLPKAAQFVACSATLSKYHASLLERMIPKKAAEEPTERPASEANDATVTPERKYRLRLVNLPPEDVLKRNIVHWALFAEGRDKIETLRKFLIAEQPAKALVFTAVGGQVENIAKQLEYRKVPCSALHAKLDKIGRKKALDDFRAGRTRVLVTSDLAARGLDIVGISHIIQMDVNENEDFFIHRAGRTARAGKSGINVILGDERELRNLARIEKKLGIVIYPKVLYGGVVRAPEPVDPVAGFDRETEESDTTNDNQGYRADEFSGTAPGAKGGPKPRREASREKKDAGKNRRPN